MYNICIYESSNVFNIAKTCCNDLCKLNALAKKEVVSIEFFNDKICVTGRRRITTKVAQKYTKNAQDLCTMIENKIKSAWNK